MNLFEKNTQMIDSEKLTNDASAHIGKNLLGTAPIPSTSDFISYIAYNEPRKNLSKLSES